MKTNDTTDQQAVYAQVATCLHNADTILFITGAGISVDSGLPTYRGVGGIYEEQQTDDGVPIEAAVSGLMFRIRPELTWKYLWQTVSACYHARPNQAHHVIARLQQEKPNLWVVTQNVDGLHRAAGTINLIEMHGYAFDLYCIQCQHHYTVEDIFPGGHRSVIFPPHCRQSACSGILRPHVVLFGEATPVDAQLTLQAVLERGLDLVISIGTTHSFPYIVAPLYTPGIPTVEINPTDTIVSSMVTYRLRVGAVEAMERIWNAFHDAQYPKDSQRTR